MKKTNTKKALGMSLISLLACGVMFAGSTYAWFTDEVVASGNKIESGTLKADMEVFKDGQWVSLKENPETKIFDYDKWEPGYTASASIKILNKGNLGFRYQVLGEFDGETFGPNGESLGDVIDVYYKDGQQSPASFAEVANEEANNGGNLSGSLWAKVGTLNEWMAMPLGLTSGYMLPKGASYDTTAPEWHNYDGVVENGFTGSFVLHMREETGNEYQGLTLGDINLTLKATQWAWEKDGFGNSDYDKVEYISLDSSSNIVEELKGLSGKAVVSIDGEIDARSYTGLAGLDVTFVGTSEDAAINFGAADTYANGSNVRFENITVKSSNTDFRGLKHSASETYVNCTIEGKRFLYGQDVSFENCKFVQNVSDYHVWTYGAKNVTFEGCEFFSAGKGILVYNEGKDLVTNVTVANSTFHNTAKGYTSAGDWVAAIEVDSSLSVNGHYTVTATNNKVSDNYNTAGAVRVKKHSNNNYTVNETGTTDTTGTVAGISSEQNVDTLLGDTLTGDATVQVLTGGNMVWTTGAAHGSTPFGGTDLDSLTIVGAGAENSTLTFVGSGVGPVRANEDGVLTIKDVTIVDETVSYAEDAWELTYLEIGEANSEVVFENVVFESGISVDSRKATFKNCTFKSPRDSEYSVWVSNGTVSFEGCTFEGTRGLKMHEAYGTEIAKVTVNNCTFDSLTKKPGIAIGTLNAATTVEISNSKFINCQAGDQNLYMYETDTDLSTITFVNTNNQVINN